jgi:dUTP pyrophosphatase
MNNQLLISKVYEEINKNSNVISLKTYEDLCVLLDEDYKNKYEKIIDKHGNYNDKTQMMIQDIVSKLSSDMEYLFEELPQYDRFFQYKFTKIEKTKQPYKQFIPTYRFALRSDLQNEPQFLPTRATKYDSGWDVRAATKDRKPLIVKPFDHIKIDLGFRAICPEGYWLKLVPRSSTQVKRNLFALYGVIDESYEGEMCFAATRIVNPNDLTDLVINWGDALGQLIPVKRQEMIVEGISNEEYDQLCKERGHSRGANGFGSTSK